MHHQTSPLAGGKEKVWSVPLTSRNTNAQYTEYVKVRMKIKTIIWTFFIGCFLICQGCVTWCTIADLREKHQYNKEAKEAFAKKEPIPSYRGGIFPPVIPVVVSGVLAVDFYTGKGIAKDDHDQAAKNHFAVNFFATDVAVAGIVYILFHEELVPYINYAPW